MLAQVFQIALLIILGSVVVLKSPKVGVFKVALKFHQAINFIINSIVVNDTNWSPTYELHAVTGGDGQPSRAVSLHYRACITQSTGEDWTNAALTLSTVATDAIVKQIPKLAPIRINVAVAYNNRPQHGPQIFQSQNQFNSAPLPPPPAPVAPGGSLFGAAAPATSGTTGFGAFAPPAASDISQPASTPDEAVDEAEGSGNESEAPEKLVTQTPMALAYSCEVKNDSEYRLPPDLLVSFWTTVTYPRLRFLTSTATMFSAPLSAMIHLFSSPTHAYPRPSKKAKVLNRKLVVRDAVPISNDSRVTVVLRQPKELVSAGEGASVKVESEAESVIDWATDVEDKGDEGSKVKWTKEKERLYEYRWRVDPDDKIRLQAIFEARASSDLTCTFPEAVFGFGQKK
ncbi:hypothetical protein D9756_002927 [Leucocoprinus leucothites]|uniref:DUF4139 domain-containing protein n=1 Tax=Leucocoprinus leucothites TaxID=201217 RepID=A0A8H5G7V6_9AGAR|nr:hypothetical protein D9756_002927 [Leucoagaricus leucothites]